MAITELKPYLSNIADKLKSLLGITDKINAQDFVEKIDEVYEQGKKSQYDEFWDNFQHNGNRTHYVTGFAGQGWNDNNFKPKYNIVPQSSKQLFADSKITDLVECLNKSGVVLDFKNATDISSLMAYSAITHIGVVDFTSIAKVTAVFYQANNLKTIDKIILKSDGSQTFESITFDCAKLENVTFEGKIGKSITFSKCSNLTHESLMGEKGIINALKDYSGTTSTYTLTLHVDAKARLSDAEKAIITQKGWTVA
jgi:hypothetical protein